MNRAIGEMADVEQFEVEANIAGEALFATSY
jgi:hypothetical protein